MRAIIATLGVLLIILIGSQVAQTLGLKNPEYQRASINVEGVAEVTAVPDIGLFSFAVEAEADDVATAQAESGEKINAIMEYLKGDGAVEETDIKTTGYNAYPRYDWVTPQLCLTGRCDQERELQGYVVTQQVSVKVRETDKAGELIGGVGALGATNLSGLSFEVDDIEGKKEEARLLAIADAKEKAKHLAGELGVRLGNIVSFNDSGDHNPVMYAETRAVAMDMAMEESAPAFAPEIAVGEDEITARVTITYEIK